MAIKEQRDELLEALATCRANFRRYEEQTLKMAQAEDEERASLRTQRDELLEALRMNAQSLAWLANGKCRGFHPGLPTVDESLDAARSAIAKATGEKS